MKKIGLVFILILVLTSCFSNEDENVLNIYSSRHYEADKKLIKKFQDRTGVKVNITQLDNNELIARITQEKENTPADIIFANGAENISALLDVNILNDINVTIPDTVNPKYFGDKWVGFSRRARVVVGDSNSKNFSTEINTYTDMTADEFEGEILVRSSSNSYNIAMIASMLQQHGEEYTTEFIKGLVDNFARKPNGNDRDQVKAIASGEGSFALVNTYYLHLMSNSSDENERDIVSEITIQTTDDLHENISFLGTIGTNEYANDFIEFMLSVESQSFIVKENGEFPVNSGAYFEGYMESLSHLSFEEVDFETLGDYSEDAYRLMIENGWD